LDDDDDDYIVAEVKGEVKSISKEVGNEDDLAIGWSLTPGPTTTITVALLHK